MNTGIRIKGGGNHRLSWNLTLGTDIGIDIEDSWGNLLNGNIHVSKESLNQYGANFIDVLKEVQKSEDIEALLALGNVLNTKPDNAIVAWEILIKKFGVQMGSFSANILAGIISAPAYSMLKSVLATHGITLP